MKEYRSIECGDINGKRCSEQLPGALAAYQDFFYTRGWDNGDPYFINMGVGVFVPSNIETDYKHDIFVDEHGAVVDAYDFGILNEEETKSVIETIIAYKKKNFPDYEFVMLPGRFPIDVDDDRATMSTHILYIKNYKEILEKLEETDKKLR